MSKMLQLVEEMHVRLNEISTSEQALLRALRDALNRVDVDSSCRTCATFPPSTRRGAGRCWASCRIRPPHRCVSLRGRPPELAHAQNGAWPQGVVEDLPRSITRHSQQRRPTTGNITAELDLYFKARAS